MDGATSEILGMDRILIRCLPWPDLLRSPLHDRHVALGAKLADFGGWEMPIEYAASGGGVLKEHAAVREAVGIFDVSHLGKATVRGAGAREFVNACLTNDLGRIVAGKAQYTLCCDETGGVVDDLIAYLVGDDEVFLVPNAANTAEVVRRLTAAAPAGDHGDRPAPRLRGARRAGPALCRRARRARATGRTRLHGLRRRGVRRRAGAGVPYRLHRRARLRAGPPVGRTPRRCGTRWCPKAASFGGLPAGLGARDTLRTEAGYPLHGQDLSLSISPVQARSTWAVGWKKDAFWGREALAARARGRPAAAAVGSRVARPRHPAGAHARALGGGDPIGEVTSGTFSPTLRKGIGLALLATAGDIAEGSEVAIDVRGRTSAMRVVRPPFVELHVR